MIPTIIRDNFFPNPDKIVDFALEQEYFPDEFGKWPGKRTHNISQLNRDFFQYIVMNILKTCSLENSPLWNFECRFHIIEPYSNSQYDPENCGWIHCDNCLFGGIIYLNKNPKKDTGTSIYAVKEGYLIPNDVVVNEKYKNFLGTEQFATTQNKLNSQYTETVNIKNVYNRLAMFSGNTFHGIQTFGKDQPRLNLAFFCHALTVEKNIMCL